MLRFLEHPVERSGQCGIHVKPVAGQSDGGQHQFAPGKPAELLVGQGEPGHRARRPADDVAVHPRIVLKHGPSCGGGRRLPVLHAGRLLSRAGVDHHEPSATDIARRRPDDRQREGGCHSRIDRRPTPLQNATSDLACRRRHRDDHAMCGAGDPGIRFRLADLARGKEQKHE